MADDSDVIGPRDDAVSRCHDSETQGYICPEDGTFVVEGHFLDSGCRHGFPRDEHDPATQVVLIYKIVPRIRVI